MLKLAHHFLPTLKNVDNVKNSGTELNTFNPFVVGSTPAGPTKNLKKDLEKSKSFFHFRWIFMFLLNLTEIRLILCK